MTGNGTSSALWTTAQFTSAFGRAFDAGKDFVGVMNADGNANSAHVEGATYYNGSIYAVFDRNTSYAIRINYLVALAR